MSDTMNISCILMGGPDRVIVDARGKRWRFEDHPQCGPIPLTQKTGEVATREPPQNSPFWDAVQCWYDQGKQIDDDGLCVWKPKPQPILKHLGGRHYEIVGYTDG